jgi:hypothetical protein
MIKYKKLFGTIRILLGALFLIYPAYEFFNQGGEQSEETMRWVFVFFFFLLYSYSAVRNGVRELAGELPAFNLPRFYEASMNGFISAYLLILIFASQLNGYAKFLLILLTLLTLLSMIRDLRIISLQYYERKQKLRK